MPRISQLPSLIAADNADEIAIVDVSASTTKKITRGDLLKAPLPTKSVTLPAINGGATAGVLTTDANGGVSVGAKTVDANGWTVYNYGAWKEYSKVWTGINPGVAPAGGVVPIVTSAPMPVGVSPSKVSYSITTLSSDGPARWYASMNVNATSTSTSETIAAHVRNLTSVSLTPTDMSFHIRLIEK